jgi:hypothetical protein
MTAWRACREPNIARPSPAHWPLPQIRWAEIEQATRATRADTTRSAGAKMPEADLLTSARVAIADRRTRSPRQGSSE